MYALIDPNWGEGERVVPGTIAGSREEAQYLAEMNPAVAMYSGYSEFPFPVGTRGKIERLEKQGYRIAEVEIVIK